MSNGLLLTRLYEIFEYRDMISSMVKRDLRGRYKGSFFGFLWNFFNPMVQIFVYIAVFGYIFRSSIPKFPLFLLVGVMPWNFFNESLCQGSGCVFSHGDMIKKIYFPREVLPLATVFSRFINFLINYAIVFVILLAVRWPINFINVLLYVPFVLLIMYIFTLAAVLILSSVNVYFRDVEYMTNVFMGVIFWLTPVMYQMDVVPGALKNIISLNPMTPIVTALQAVLYHNSLPTLSSLLRAFGLSVLLLIVAELIFIKLEKRFAEEM